MFSEAGGAPAYRVMSSNFKHRRFFRTFAMIKPDAVSRSGEIIHVLYRQGFLICQMKKVSLTRAQAVQFYAEHEGKPYFEKLMNFMTSGPVIAMELMAEDCVRKWRDLLGPTNASQAKVDAPNSIRAQFGTDGTRNACHGSDSESSAKKELDFFFGLSSPASKAQLKDCTLCVVKPHAVRTGLAGSIIQAVSEYGFTISAVQMFNLEKANAEEFYEVYKGVVNEYGAMVEELCSGSCIAMEITHPENAPKSFREFVGPSDPEIARHLRSQSLRAKFGVDKIRNAVHCTDLPEDGQLEVEYFFRILTS